MEYDEVEKKMKPFELKDPDKAIVRRVNRLKGDKLAICRTLLDRHPGTGRELSAVYETMADVEKANNHKRDAVAQMEAMLPKERIKIFEAVFGPIAQEVELFWQFIPTQSFSTGSGRRAFRFPGNEEVYRDSRLNWLFCLRRVTEDYQRDFEFYLEYAPYVGWAWGDALGLMFAAVIDQGGERSERVLRVLIDQAIGDNRPGEMGNHAIVGLLSADREEGWEAIEKLLLTAQRQEGLRQSIFERVDFGHPQAYLRMLRLMLEENLLRFSSAARAIDVWFQLEWDARSVKEFRRLVEMVLKLLEDPKARKKVLSGTDAEAAYFALWSTAYFNVEEALPLAAKLLKHKEAEHRFAAVYFLSQVHFIEAYELLDNMLVDPDLRVAAMALQTLCGGSLAHQTNSRTNPENYAHLVSLLDRLPQSSSAKQLEPLVWPWVQLRLSASEVADQLPRHALKKVPAKQMLTYMGRMSPTGRRQMAAFLNNEINDPICREALLGLTSDRSAEVANIVFQYLEKAKLDEEECCRLEVNLKRTSSNFRRGAIQLLAGQSGSSSLASAERLLGANAQPQRLAGLDLLGQIYIKKKKDEKFAQACREVADSFRQSRSKLSIDEAKLLEAFEESKEDTLTLHNCLGLIDPANLTLPRPMEDKDLPILTQSAVNLIQSLDKFISANAQAELDLKVCRNYGGEDCDLLGEVQWGWPSPDSKNSVEENLKRLPLAKLWQEWWQNRPEDLRDSDGGETLRAMAALSWSYDQSSSIGWAPNFIPNAKFKLPHGEIQHRSFMEDLLEWFVFLYCREPKHRQLALDTWETSCARYGQRHLKPEGRANHIQLLDSSDGPQEQWAACAKKLHEWMAEAWSDREEQQLWEIDFWSWRPTLRLSSGKVIESKIEFNRPVFENIARAFERKQISRDDVIYFLIGRRDAFKRSEDYHESGGFHFGNSFETAIRECTQRNRIMRQVFEKYPSYPTIINEVRERVLNVELQRGDLPTIASPIANQIYSVEGAKRFVELATAVQAGKLARTSSWNQPAFSRSEVFSDLLKHCYLAPEDTSASFSKLVTKAELHEQALVELALYVPRWTRFIANHLQWKGLHDAVLWYQAHTKEPGMEYKFQSIMSGESSEYETDDMLWLKDITERTALGPQDLIDGAVDVKWFMECYQQLGADRWQKIHDAAKYASSGIGHTRAKIFADAMLGQLKKTDLVNRIKDKRHQDSVRALGLLPLAKGKTAETDILNRYEVMQEFLRGSKKFGSQRQASEKRATEIGLANLARTAGYADPIRLEWAMEAQAVEDLADGSISISKDGVTVTLTINPWSEPEMSIEQNGKALKSVPSKLKKDEDIKALTARKTTLKRQLSRMRLSLEAMMCRGEKISGRELQEMFTNPLLRHMLTQLLFVSEDGELAGYPSNQGKTLIGYKNNTQAIGSKDVLRLAHPYDLFQRDDWSEWQKECFAHERIQPFKQVFRELYPLTPSEKKSKKADTDRYAGHQVNPRQALALLGSRGWVNVPEEGVRKTFHDLGISVWLSFEEGFYTPAEVEGLTLEGVNFSRRNDGKPIKLTELSPRLFSEVMRDMDLIVSVAHMGGVDPEASQSTVEMRQALVQETSRLLQLNNVKFKANTAIIDGSLARYSVHLGSAITHKLPGGALFIVPVRSQHRGRIFLPFADNDPKTAELLSKIILLARDSEIKDPSILDQIRGK